MKLISRSFNAWRKSGHGFPALLLGILIACTGVTALVWTGGIIAAAGVPALNSEESDKYA